MVISELVNQVLKCFQRHRFNLTRIVITHFSELLATYLLHNLKWELLGKTVLLPATVVYQARRVVPTLKEFVLVCQHQQVDACVDVTVMVRTTMSTRPFTDIHRLLLAFDATRRTDLRRCEPGVRLDERPSVEGTFVFQLSDELVPTDIPDGLRYLVILHHVLRLQCLHDDDLVLVNDPSRQLVKEVLALVGNLFVFLGQK